MSVSIAIKHPVANYRPTTFIRPNLVIIERYFTHLDDKTNLTLETFLVLGLIG
jgi:hypothetical protein